MRKADRLKTPLVIILGEEELKKNRVLLRDMVTKTQEEVPWKNWWQARPRPKV